MMNAKVMEDRSAEVPLQQQRRAAVVVAVAALMTWVVAAVLIWVVVPLLLGDPELVAEGIEGAAPVVSLFAVVVLAGAGVVMLAGLAVVWSVPRTIAGRIVLLAGGCFAIFGGLLTMSMGTFDIGWRGTAAVIGLFAGAVQVAAGLAACMAAIREGLPGTSLLARMLPPENARPIEPPSQRMLPLVAVLVLGTLVGTASVVAHTDAAMYGFLTVQFLMPVLAGAVVAGWREGMPNRLKTLGLSALAGIATTLLFLAALALTYYQFNPIGFAVWWAVIGATCGSLGYAAWGPLTHRAPRLQPR